MKWILNMVLLVSFFVVITSFDSQAQVDAWQNNYDKSVQAYQENNFKSGVAYATKALTLAEKIWKTDCDEIAGSLEFLALNLIGLQKYDEASEYLHRAIGIWKKTRGSNSYQVAVAFGNLGEIYLCQEAYTDAKTMIIKAIKILEKEPKKHATDLITVYFSLSNIYLMTDELERAESTVQKALDLAISFFGAQDDQVAALYYQIGHIQWGRFRYKDALVSLKRVLLIDSDKSVFEISVINELREDLNNLELIVNSIEKNDEAITKGTDFDFTTFPRLPKPKKIDQNIKVYELELSQGDSAGNPRQIWIYLPKERHRRSSLPCVIIAAAGSNLINGMKLAEGDRPEHLPYVKKGMAVVAISLDGAYKGNLDLNDFNDPKFYNASGSYFKSRAGIQNARYALDLIDRRIPSIDMKRIYAVGHSSAGAFALLLAAHEPRIKKCVAMNAITDVEMRYKKDIMLYLKDSQIKWLYNGMLDTSPILNVERVNCPVFLFHTVDDEIVEIEHSRKYYRKMKALGKEVVIKEVERGNHYNGMISHGIPWAISCLTDTK